jgi:hypothetical protein
MEDHRSHAYRPRHFADRPGVVHDDNVPLQKEPLPPHADRLFRPLPEPPGEPPYHLSLEEVLPADQMEQIRSSGRIAFHVAGDTGGVKSPEPQIIVMKHMERDFATPDPAARPTFFYHLGDVVYFYGEITQYYAQFYEPAAYYPAPIFAIPGNHDGDVFDDTASTLSAFVNNFCAREPRHNKEAGDALRDAMTQPNVYWTLEAPFVTIIGLYTNVPEGGMLDEHQIAWLESELAQAPADKALLLAMHNPVYSADGYHSGSPYLATTLDRAIERSGRVPDAFLAGHVHNYQRFTRTWKEREIPYLVVGSGGFWQLYSLLNVRGGKIKTPLVIPNTDVTLENYCDDRHGYLLLEVSEHALNAKFLSVPRPQEAWSAPAVVHDSFTLDLHEHRLLR